jgi:aminoglycoside 6-adenylyltransferase
VSLEATAARWARERADVHALLLVGSRARADAPADEWSDHDFVVVADEPDRLLRDDGWIAALGPWLLSFTEAAAAGGVRERRVLFADGAQADFTVLAPRELAAVLARPDVAEVLARGVRVLVDDGVVGKLPAGGGGEAPAEDLAALAQEFWFSAILTARKLRRGELHVAVQSCNCTLRTLLQRVLAAEAREAGRDAWHRGRFFERWADPRRREAMAATVAPADPAGAAAAITAAADLFTDVCAALEREHGPAVGIDLPAVRAQLDATLGTPA